MMMKRPFAKVVVAVACAVLAGTAAADELVKYTVDKDNYSIPEPLTATAGDAAKGRAAAIDRKRGNCLACHTMPVPEQPFHGLIAPPLASVGARYDAGQLRLRVVDPKALNPNTPMPSFYKDDGIFRPSKQFAGKPILSAQEVEDVVAYLLTLQ